MRLHSYTYIFISTIVHGKQKVKRGEEEDDDHEEMRLKQRQIFYTLIHDKEKREKAFAFLLIITMWGPSSLPST